MRAAIPFFALATAPCWAQAVSFTKDVVPIFANYCLGCHAAGVKMGSLDLENYDAIRKGGNHGTIIVPGKSDESRLYLMVAGKAKPAMPMDGRSLAAGEVDVIRKWIDAGAPAPTAAELAELKQKTTTAIKPRVPVKPQIFSMAWRPDGKMIAAGGFKEVRLFDPAGKPTGALSGHAEVVRAVAFSRDGRLLAAAGGLPARKGEVKIWDVAQGKELRTIQGHADAIYAVAFSPDGKQVATSSYDKLIKLWDVESGAEARTLKDHIDAVYALAFTPDGKYLVSGAADRTVKIWNPATGERLYTLGDPTDGINTIALDPSGKLVAAGGLDKTIRIWSLGDKGGKLAHSLIAHEDAILKLSWSPDGKTLVSSAADRTIKIFRVEDLTEIKSIPAQPDWVYGLDFAPDGKRFAAGRYDGTLAFYEVTQGSSLASVR